MKKGHLGLFKYRILLDMKPSGLQNVFSLSVNTLNNQRATLQIYR